MNGAEVIKIFKEHIESIDELIGKRARNALFLVILFGFVAYSAGHAIGSGAERLANFALAICALFGIIVTGYGIFTTQPKPGLGYYKGMIIGVASGAIAAVTGGSVYYLLDIAECCDEDPLIKLFRLLAGSIPIGAALGALSGALAHMTVPSVAATKPGRRKRIANAVEFDSPGEGFLNFLIGLFFLILLIITFFFMFNNFDKFTDSTPQGYMRLWQLCFVLLSYSVVFVFLIVYRYGRKDIPDVQNPNNLHSTSPFPGKRSAKAFSSAIATAVCIVILFTIPVFYIGHTDFQPREQTETCILSNTPEDRPHCPDCKQNSGQPACRNDPLEKNTIEGITSRVLLLLALVFVAIIAGVWPHSPIVRLIDRICMRFHSRSGRI